MKFELLSSRLWLRVALYVVTDVSEVPKSSIFNVLDVYPGDGGDSFVWNLGNHPQGYTAS
jgi:hypothetical protein